MLYQGQTSNLPARRVHPAPQQVTVVLASQHALGWENLGDIRHVAVQLGHAAGKIHDVGGLKAQTHSVREKLTPLQVKWRLKGDFSSSKIQGLVDI